MSDIDGKPRMRNFEVRIGWIETFIVALPVAILLDSTCTVRKNSDNLRDIHTKLELLVNKNIINKNVIGGEAPEKFYEINGQRVYLEIDGKPVEEYFRK